MLLYLYNYNCKLFKCYFTCTHFSELFNLLVATCIDIKESYCIILNCIHCNWDKRPTKLRDVHMRGPKDIRYMKEIFSLKKSSE